MFGRPASHFVREGPDKLRAALIRHLVIPCKVRAAAPSLAETKVFETLRRIFPSVKRFLQGWLINTLAVLVAVWIVPGIRYEKPLDLLLASLILGILNAVLRPFLLFLALPLVLFTLGLFTFFINALLLYFVGNAFGLGFFVDSFGAAFLGALIISVVSVILSTLTGTGRTRIALRHRGRPSNHNGEGPIIDI